MKKTSVTLQDVKEAAERIRTYICRTPLLREKTMDKILGCEVYLKPEMLQITGSFKLRGAMNIYLTLTEEEKKCGIICSSSGNHGQACAYAGQMLGIHTVVVVPEDAQQVKIENARKMGAEVIEWDRAYAARWKKVNDEIAEHGYTMAHGYEDYNVMAGQGTIALEIMEDLTDVETVLVPIGGGGLISGIATAIKETNPKIRVIGVQAAATCAYYVSRQNGQKTRVQCTPTLADGIGCSYPADNPYPIIERYVDEIVVVEEEDIRESVKLVAHHAKLIAEPTSCVVIAALLSGRVKTRPDEKVVFVLTSGNWDIDKIGMILNNEPLEGEIAT